MRTYLRLLLKPKRYLIGENEADILETFLKKKWSPETISSVCFDKKISHQTIYNYIEHERQLEERCTDIYFLRGAAGSMA